MFGFSARRWLLLVVIASVSILPRLFFLTIPFERDEGVYSYIADVVLRGGVPYLDAFDHKPPGVYYIYASAVKLFGHTVSAPRVMAAVFVFLACIAAACLVYRLSSNFLASLVVMPCLGLASASLAYTGYDANTEIFTLPFIVWGICLVIKGDEGQLAWFLSGLFFGVGIMIKQPVLLIALAAVVPLWASDSGNRQHSLKKAVLYGLGMCLPFILTASYFLVKGAFANFWVGFWEYNVGYVGAGPMLKDSIKMFILALVRIVSLDPMTWSIGIIGIAAYMSFAASLRTKVSFLAFLAASFAAATMGGNFYTHYFIFVVPFLAMGVAFLAGSIFSESHGIKSVALGTAFVFCMGIPLFTDASLTSKEILERAYNGHLPFYQAVALGRFLKSNAKGNKRALIIGSEPELYFYSGLQPASSIFYYYPVQFPTKFQETFRERLYNDNRLRPPDYMLFVNAYNSHLIDSPASDGYYRKLRLLFADYRLIGVSRYGSDVVITDAAALHDRKFVLTRDNILLFEKDGLSPSQDKPLLSSFIAKGK